MVIFMLYRRRKSAHNIWNHISSTLFKSCFWVLISVRLESKIFNIMSQLIIQFLALSVITSINCAPLEQYTEKKIVWYETIKRFISLQRNQNPFLVSYNTMKPSTFFESFVVLYETIINTYEAPNKLFEGFVILFKTKKGFDFVEN